MKRLFIMTGLFALAVVSIGGGLLLSHDTASAAPTTADTLAVDMNPATTTIDSSATVPLNTNFTFGIQLTTSPDTYQSYASNIQLPPFVTYASGPEEWGSTGTTENAGAGLGSAFLCAPGNVGESTLYGGCARTSGTQSNTGLTETWTIQCTANGTGTLHLNLTDDVGSAVATAFGNVNNTNTQLDATTMDATIICGTGVSATDTPTATNTSAPTSTNTATATATNTAIPTNTNTPTNTPTNTATPTNTNTPTATNTAAPTNTNTPTSTATNTAVPTNTNTPTATNTAVPTNTNTPTATATNTAVATSTNTATATATNTAVPTNTNTPTATATNTAVATSTNTATATPTNTAVATSTNTATSTPTNTAVATSTPTNTATNTPIPPTATNTSVPPTATNTPIPPTATNTPVPPTATNTPVAPTSTNTAVATSTATATPTGQCLTFTQKVNLIIGILTHFNAQEGSSRYDAQYDVNGDGIINFTDLIDVLLAPLCPPHHHR